VIAAIVGTRAVIDPDDAAMIRGFLINKFRGDPALFEDGYRLIEQLAGWRGFGVVPWLAPAARLPSEDAVILERPIVSEQQRIVIACPITPRIANFDDLDPLKLEPGVEVRMIAPGQPIPAEAALVVLAGSKATIADLAFLRAEGWDIDILAHYRRGGHVLGLCGGYQMLGDTISDPHGVEGPSGRVAGLGLLKVDTVLAGRKTLERVNGTALGTPFQGYEIHMGETTGPDTARPVARMADGRSDGAISADGRIAGSYVHGLLDLAGQRAAWLARIGGTGRGIDQHAAVDRALDEIAALLEIHLDIDALVAMSQMAQD
jgi:adenosylcobyric acid synthase